MYQIFMFITTIAMITTAIQPNQQPITKLPQVADSSILFAHKEHPDLYWEALVQVANGNKDAALKIVDALQRGIPLAVKRTWQEDQPESIDAFFDKLFVTTVMRDPQRLTQLGLFESIGITEHNALLTDISVQAVLQGWQDTKDNLHRLKRYSIESLSDEQKISYKVFSWMLQHAVDGEKFLFHEYKVRQLFGQLSQLTSLFTQYHKLETEQDVQNYLARLRSIAHQLQQATDVVALQQERGIVPPRFTVEKVLTILTRSMPESIEKNIFYAHLQEKTTKLDLPNRAAMLTEAYQIIEQEVVPAYKKLHARFTQLLESAQANNGVWALPEGEEYYAYMLKFHTTTNLSADEVYALGLQEVAQIHKEMRTIFAAEGLNDPSKSVGTLLNDLSKNKKFYYPNTQEGRAQCLTDYGVILERSRKELAHLFDLKPQTGVKIQQVPAHEEGGAPAAYYFRPSMDGTRPGIFFANLRDMNEVTQYRMETLTIHEAEPGHHFQLALQTGMNLPMLRKSGGYTAYCEGWALYTEKLAYEQGFYSSSWSKLGNLQDELLRAVRLVVDTGLHHKRWTREQAIAYMEEMTGDHHNSVVTEVERYMVLPGQACAYKIGQLKILELRQRAKDLLGAKFDIKAFHNVVLNVAAVPLTVLEEVVDQYIQDVLIKI